MWPDIGPVGILPHAGHGRASGGMVGIRGASRTMQLPTGCGAIKLRTPSAAGCALPGDPLAAAGAPLALLLLWPPPPLRLCRGAATGGTGGVLDDGGV